MSVFWAEHEKLPQQRTKQHESYFLRCHYPCVCVYLEGLFDWRFVYWSLWGALNLWDAIFRMTYIFIWQFWCFCASQTSEWPFLKKNVIECCLAAPLQYSVHLSSVVCAHFKATFYCLQGCFHLTLESFSFIYPVKTMTEACTETKSCPLKASYYCTLSLKFKTRHCM